MSTDLIRRAFHGQAVRVITDEHGDPWFVATDVARILGYAAAKDMTRRLDDDEKGGRSVPTPGGTQTVTVITEPGLYGAVLGSQVPGAKEFKRWVKHELLPSIRRTGVYALPQTREQRIALALVESQQVITEQTERLAIAEPKAEAFDAFLSTAGDLAVRDAAHVLSRDGVILTGEKRLRDWMLANRWLYRDNTGKPRAFQHRIDQGSLSEKAQWHYHPETGERVMDTPQVRVTARGLDLLAKALTKRTDQGEFEVAS
jgi:prophage antirepressor-like protein